MRNKFRSSGILWPRRSHLWLLTLPFIWQVFLVPVVNDITLTPLGIPFPMFWQILGVLLSTLLFAFIFWIDRQFGLEEAEEKFLSATQNREDAE